MHKRKIEWDLFMGFFYLVAFILDPLVYVFDFSPLHGSNTRATERIITGLIIIDICLTLITGYPKDDTVLPEDEEAEQEQQIKVDKKTKVINSNRKGNTRGL